VSARALGVVAVLAAALAVAWGPFGGGDGRLLRAEFTSARGLLEGNEVRVQGAPAGSVDEIELTDRNTALVTLRLDEAVPAPRRDATAAVRPVDLLGDVHLALDLGDDPAPLTGAIPAARTSNAPRLDDLLRAFDPRARHGLQALVVALGQGLERRGDDAHEAVLRLRPALEATDALMRELDDQRAALRELVADARRAAGQLAARDEDLDATVRGLAATLETFAARAGGVDRALRDAPGLLGRLQRTSTALERTAGAAVPLARELGRAAPDLTAVARDLPAFARDAEQAVDDARPLVRDLGTVLRAARPAAPRLAEGFTALAAAAPDIDRVSAALVPAAKPISEGFFVNFADQAAEPGKQPFDPFADARRRYWRGAAVFSCEAFGMDVRAGCLSRYLGRRARRQPTARAPRPAAQPPRATAPPPAGPRDGAPPLPAVKLPALPPAVEQIVGKVLDAVEARRDTDLLDFLLGP